MLYQWTLFYYQTLKFSDRHHHFATATYTVHNRSNVIIVIIIYVGDTHTEFDNISMLDPQRRDCCLTETFITVEPRLSEHQIDCSIRVFCQKVYALLE